MAEAIATPTKATAQLAERLFREHQQSVFVQTDHLFAALMFCQWIAGVFVAIWVSPRTWAGQYSDVHIHVWMALFLGGVITAWPIFLALKKPGEVITRHSIAVGQMLYSSLLIHLTGGRIESHFHVFGSLAFLSFYRDWRVLLSASAVVGVDHLLRGLLFPQSVYGVVSIEPWRWLEHLWWVLFEDTFLIYSCRRNVSEMRIIALREAEREAVNAMMETTVQLRTGELCKAESRLTMQYTVASILTEATSLDEAITLSLNAIIEYLQIDDEQIFACYWSPDELLGVLTCGASIQLPESLPGFAEGVSAVVLPQNVGLPGSAWGSRKLVHMSDLGEAVNFPRQTLAKNFGLKCGFAFPIVATNSVLGVFEFLFKRQYCGLTQDDREVFEAIGNQIGQFIVRKQAEMERERLANIVKFSNDAIFTKAADGTITSWNKGAEMLLGYTLDEIKGKPSSILLPDGSITTDESTLESAIALGDHWETQRAAKGGRLIDVSLSVSPMFDRAGHRSGCSVTMRDITERKQAERRVNEFYSMVSHELRTPLTSIRGSLRLIQSNIVPISSDEAMELIEVARDSTDRLIRLINDILDLKKIEAGKMPLTKSKVDVQQLVSQTLGSLRAMAEEAGVRILDVTTQGSVHADRDRAMQILTNLVSNAIKFSPCGSEVTVIAEPNTGGQIRFSVVDNGPGISAEDIQKLFGKFQQIDSSDTRQKGGTGLGLAISKALVEEHGGTVGVESTPGRGSKFWFTLPAHCNTDRASTQFQPRARSARR